MKRSDICTCIAVVLFFVAAVALLVLPGEVRLLLPLTFAVASLLFLSLAHRATVRDDSAQSRRWLVIALVFFALAFIVFIAAHFI